MLPILIDGPWRVADEVIVDEVDPPVDQLIETVGLRFIIHQPSWAHLELRCDLQILVIFKLLKYSPVEQSEHDTLNLAFSEPIQDLLLLFWISLDQGVDVDLVVRGVELVDLFLNF